MPQDGKHIIGYREAMTLREQPQRMLVCGSGAIGSEFAYFYQSIGTQVTLVEFMPQILPNEDEEVAAQIDEVQEKINRLSGNRLPVLASAILALPVLPSVVITDLGLVDGSNQTFIPVFIQ